MSEREFVEKHGFSLEDLEVAYIDNIMSKNFLCYTVSEAAYKIAEDLYKTLDYNVEEYYIEYNLLKTKYGGVHKIAIFYEDLVFIFDLMWLNSALAVIDYEIITKEEYNTFKGFENIDIALEEYEIL